MAALESWKELRAEFERHQSEYPGLCAHWAAKSDKWLLRDGKSFYGRAQECFKNVSIIAAYKSGVRGNEETLVSFWLDLLRGEAGYEEGGMVAFSEAEWNAWGRAGKPRSVWRWPKYGLNFGTPRPPLELNLKTGEYEFYFPDPPYYFLRDGSIPNVFGASVDLCSRLHSLEQTEARSLDRQRREDSDRADLAAADAEFERLCSFVARGADFWAKIREEFEDLEKAEEAGSREQWTGIHYTYEVPFTPRGVWQCFQAPTARLRDRFLETATRAAEAAGCPPNIDAVAYWSHFALMLLLREPEAARMVVPHPRRAPRNYTGDKGAGKLYLLNSSIRLCSNIARVLTDRHRSGVTVVKTSDNNSRSQPVEKKMRKGDISLLQGRTSVSLATAMEYTGLSDRQIRALAANGSVQRVGKGQSKKFDVESLKAYVPPENSEQSGKNRK
jgi:hypothetical protein